MLTPPEPSLCRLYWSTMFHSFFMYYLFLFFFCSQHDFISARAHSHTCPPDVQQPPFGFGLKSWAWNPLKVKGRMVSLNLQATWCWMAAARWPWRRPACSSSPGCLSSTCSPGASSMASWPCPPTLLRPRPCCSCSSCLMFYRRPSPSR